MEDEWGWWRRGHSSLWDCALHKVRDQPGGPQQLTAAAFLSLMRMVVLVETVSGKDSRKEVRLGNGMKTSRGTLSFGIALLLSSLWIMPLMSLLWKYCQYQGEELNASIRRDNVWADAVLKALKFLTAVTFFAVLQICVFSIFELREYLIWYNWF